MKKPVKLAFGAVFLLFALIFFTLLTSRHAFFADPEEAAKQTAIFMLEKRSAGELSRDSSIRKEELAKLAGRTSAVYIDFTGAGLESAYFSGDMVIITSDVIFQKVEGYVYSKEPLASGSLKIPGSGYDCGIIRISRTETADIYRFTAGL